MAHAAPTAPEPTASPHVSSRFVARVRRGPDEKSAREDDVIVIPPGAWRLRPLSGFGT